MDRVVAGPSQLVCERAGAGSARRVGVEGDHDWCGWMVSVDVFGESAIGEADAEQGDGL